jgi:hypothetical protein
MGLVTGWFRLDASSLSFAVPVLLFGPIFEEFLGHGPRNASRNGPVTVEGYGGGVDGDPRGEMG